ncbi:MAG: rod shape-determining protein MreD [Bacteroidota bacterium]
MTKQISSNIFLFILLLLMQVLVADNIRLFGFGSPLIYVLFIIALPVNSPRWLLLILGFAMGLCVDMFHNTPGMHSTATLFMAFIRPFVLGNASPREDFEYGVRPSIQTMKFASFFSYASILIVIHHVSLFLIEAFSWNDFLNSFLRTLVRIIFTLFLVLLSQYLFVKKQER